MVLASIAILRLVVEGERVGPEVFAGSWVLLERALADMRTAIGQPAIGAGDLGGRH
jgi:hypothetical protein